MTHEADTCNFTGEAICSALINLKKPFHLYCEHAPHFLNLPVGLVCNAILLKYFPLPICLYVTNKENTSRPPEICIEAII